MELRSYNVEKIYSTSVICRVGDELGVKKNFFDHTSDIREMLLQIKTENGKVHLCACNKREDGEIWTPYLQIVEMLILMGKRIGCVQFNEKLKPETLITILCQ